MTGSRGPRRSASPRQKSACVVSRRTSKTFAVQAAVLVPFLRSAGYRFRPRFDLRGTGLGHTFRLARWTLGFVAVTQVALVDL